MGFPIRTPSDQRSFDSSPRPIAAYHVLHRLKLPRHPPCALTTHTKNTYKAKSKNKDARVHYTVLKQHTPHTITNHHHGQQPHMEQETTRHTQSEKCCSRHPTMHQRTLFFKQCETPNSSFSCLTVCCNPTTTWRGCASTQKHCVFHTKNNKLLRKEVIQPHLPVRLPCYDLVPIANPTLDGSLPEGLGHRLWVLPTFVT